MTEDERLRRALDQIDNLWTNAYPGFGDRAVMWVGVPAWTLDVITKAARKQLQPTLPWMPIDAWLEANT